MDSTSLTEFAFWLDWTRSTAEKAPPHPGVYIFRMSGRRRIGRIKGESDVLYVGCSTSIRARLKHHLSPQTLTRDTGYRLNRVRQEIGPLEVSWRPLESRAQATDCERKLLASYETDHIELPPLNCQESGKKMRQVEDLFRSLSPDQMKELLARCKRRSDLSRQRVESAYCVSGESRIAEEARAQGIPVEEYAQRVRRGGGNAGSARLGIARVARAAL